MKITFFGAAKGVTGSCHMIETNNKKFLIDCGLFQGTLTEQILNYEPFPFDVKDIDFVILTHAHIDHSGRIPKLYKEGFRGNVYATKATCDLLQVMLPDSGHIQEKEIEWVNRKRMRAGKKPEPPVYTVEDAIKSCTLLKQVKYDTDQVIDNNITFKYKDAGHMLGSTIVELYIKEEEKVEKIVFSGDLGNDENPIIKNPTMIDETDYLVLESTYGNRLHPPIEEESARFIDVIVNTIKQGGNVVIPSFAVGRTQEILFELNKYLEEKESNKEILKTLRNVPVVVDSPLATNATEIFKDNTECYNDDALNYLLNGDNPISFKNLKFTASSDDSKALNEDLTPKIIISASGMCEAGRVKHHLKHNLWRKESTILFVGYQAEGTLGRKILEGAKTVKIFGEEIGINAKIEHFNSFSAHADQKGLLDFVSGFKTKIKKIFLVHGEEEPMNVLAEIIKNKFGIDVIMPNRDSVHFIGNEKYELAVYNLKQTNLKLSIHELLAYLKQDIDSLSKNVKMDLKQNLEEHDLFEVKSELEELREYIDKFKTKEYIKK